MNKPDINGAIRTMRGECESGEQDNILEGDELLNVEWQISLSMTIKEARNVLACLEYYRNEIDNADAD